MNNLKRKITFLFSALALCAGLSLGAISCASYQRTVVVEKETKVPRTKGHAVASDKHFKNGVKFYSKGKFKKAIKHFQKSLAKHPKNWEAHYYLGLSHRELHDYKLSTYRLELALHQCPKNAKVKSRIHTAFGLTYELAGKPKKANGSFTLALEFNPRNAKAQKGFERIKDNKKNKKQKKRARGKKSRG